MTRHKLIIIGIMISAIFFLANTASALYPIYPKILTKKNWDKKKGKIAKIHGKTGMGGQLAKVENLFKKIDWQNKFDANNMKSKTRENLEKFDDEAKAYWKEAVKPCYDELMDVIKLADNLADKWKKKKTIPKKSRKLVETISKEASDFRVVLKSVDNTILKPSIKNVEGQLERTEKTARKMLDMWVDKIEKGIKIVEKNPTYDTYSDNLHQKVRGLGTAVAQIPELRDKWAPQWRVLSSDGFVMKFKDIDAKTMKQKLDKIEDTLKKFKKDI